MTSDSVAPCPQAWIDRDSLTALSDDEMPAPLPNWCHRSNESLKLLYQIRNELREDWWLSKRRQRRRIADRRRDQRIERRQGKMKTIREFHATNSSEEAEARQEALRVEEESANAEQQAEEEPSNAEQAEEEPSNAEQAAEDAPDGETEQDEGHSE
jgi:hypothetical protein